MRGCLHSEQAFTSSSQCIRKNEHRPPFVEHSHYFRKSNRASLCEFIQAWAIFQNLAMLKNWPRKLHKKILSYTTASSFSARELSFRVS